MIDVECLDFIWCSVIFRVPGFYLMRCDIHRLVVVMYPCSCGNKLTDCFLLTIGIAVDDKVDDGSNNKIKLIKRKGRVQALVDEIESEFQ